MQLVESADVEPADNGGLMSPHLSNTGRYEANQNSDTDY
jgi:hypothetical protein